MFITDLHIHSKYSRATSKHLTIPHLAAWGAIKGIDILATGDFTHPEWMEYIEKYLFEDDTGLFSLTNSSDLSPEIPWRTISLSSSSRFLLGTEISLIYKKQGKVRKNHNLVFMPTLASAKKFTRKLAQVGNLASDGRPILGLDARDLLEMVLETHPDAFLVPAHIWTPWFSLFGSKSGFDSIEACFGDLAGEIFALETGLSSDPEMNWLCSSLDQYTLISNSDAHSGENLAREATLFSGEQSFSGIRQALQQKESSTRYAGTLEFYPEEGKYHFDGHRKCGVVFDPFERQKNGDICPVCGQPLTIGVYSRVLELADRFSPVRPENHPGYMSLVPLRELLSEITGVGPGSKKVTERYASLVQEFGSELKILRDISVRELQGEPLLAEALRRMRAGKVLRTSGYDGEYGKISMFTPEEKKELRHGKMFTFGHLFSEEATEHKDGVCSVQPQQGFSDAQVTEALPEKSLNDMQLAAIMAKGPVLVLAGPGTGKTHTLLARILERIERGVHPEKILVVTFSRRAAREIQERLQALGGESILPTADTLHALALEHWIHSKGEKPVLLSEDGAWQVFQEANAEEKAKEIKAAWSQEHLSRERGLQQESLYSTRYAEHKARWGLIDYTDLLECWVADIEAGHCEGTYEHVLVDEVQDISPLQLRIIAGLARSDGQGVFVIGDPLQSIYGFRGALPDVEMALKNFWPEITRVRLLYNYRSAQNILSLSATLFSDGEQLKAIRQDEGHIFLFSSESARQEASWIAARIRDLLGGTAHWQADRAESHYAPGDIAVLVRLQSLVKPLQTALENAGIPVSIPEKEPFFMDDRVRLLLDMAAELYGLPRQSTKELPHCPLQILEKGPLGLAAFFEETSPFDRVFWKTRPFVELEQVYRALGDWKEILNMAALEQEFSAIRHKAEKVQIMTLHGAKGLEFEHVFLPALEEGVLPFAGPQFFSGQQDIERKAFLGDEAHLFYVGLTRAKKSLYMSYSSARRLFGRELRLGMSSLLRRLPRDMARQSTVKRRTRVEERQLTLFRSA